MRQPTFPSFDHTDPPVVQARLLESLPPLHRTAYKLVSQQQGQSVYLVGGIVRDLLLGRANYDLDFVCMLPASTVVGQLLPSFHLTFGPAVKVLEHSQFGTVRVDLDQALHLDFATARREVYRQPAALPTVSFPATLDQDLLRRDFTFNAMALSTGGQFYDPFNGLADLRDGWLRVLHPASFIDDPTRMVRGVRFAARLGYRFEPQTESWLTEALDGGYFARLSAERKRNELKLILKEDRPQPALALLDHYRLMTAIHPALRWNNELLAAFDRLEQQKLGLRWTEHLAVLLHRHDPVLAGQVLADLRFDRAESAVALDLARLWSEVGPDLQPDLKNSRLYDLLHPFQAAALRLFQALLTGDPRRDLVARYIEKVAARRPSLTGQALINLGIPSGPRHKVLLAHLRVAVLDNEVSGIGQEEAFLKRLIEQGF